MTAVLLCALAGWTLGLGEAPAGALFSGLVVSTVYVGSTPTSATPSP